MAGRAQLQNRDHRILALLLVLAGSCLAQVEGYYMYLFMDGGVGLTSRTSLPAADSLQWEWECLDTEFLDYQQAVLVGDEDDSNGRLLYPDGEPRYAILYVNGGQSTTHGFSLGETGRERLRQFYYRGGSYVGTCAGAFFAGMGRYPDYNNSYLHIWPGWTQGTGVFDIHTDHSIPVASSLLSYSDFGGDMTVDSIYHWGGCSFFEMEDWPAETEVLLRYDYHPIFGKASCIKYRAADSSGTLVVTGSHPEGIADGDALELFRSMLELAWDGRAEHDVKAELQNGEPRIMDLLFEENEPAFTRIGDLQYHHFKFQVPSEAGSFMISLDADDDYEFELYASHESLAFASQADTASLIGGADHVLVVPDPEPGIWYIGVKCASTVQTYDSIYLGDLSVLNGVEYSIMALWDTGDLTRIDLAYQEPDHFKLIGNFPNPFNPSTSILFTMERNAPMTMTIQDLRGREVHRRIFHDLPLGTHAVSWAPNKAERAGLPAGVYICTLSSGHDRHSIKLLYLQ